MCDNGYNVTFWSKDCEIWNEENGKLVAKPVKTQNNVYVFDESIVSCYMRKTNQTWLWHRRLGHMNFGSLIKVSKIEAVRGFPRLSRPDNSIYKYCQFGKKTRNQFKIKEFSSSKPMDLIHTDICSPTRIKILTRERYFILLIDDFTRATWIMLLK